MVAIAEEVAIGESVPLVRCELAKLGQHREGCQSAAMGCGVRSHDTAAVTGDSECH